MSLASQISAWNQQRRADLVNSYNKKRFKASGDWANRLEPTQNIGALNINVKMKGPDYTFYMINGRKAGKFPPVGALRQWIDDKNIKPKGNITKDQLAYLIGRKIAQEGIKPSAERKRLLTDVYTKQKIDELIDIIKVNTIFDLRQDLLKILK